MEDEHFGISVVELQVFIWKVIYQASGCLTVAHNSGGPSTDIIKQNKSGFLCKTVEEYAETIDGIYLRYKNDKQSIMDIIKEGKKSSQTFSHENFMKGYNEGIMKYLE